VTDRGTDRQIDRQTDRQIDRQTDRQTDRHSDSIYAALHYVARPKNDIHNRLQFTEIADNDPILFDIIISSESDQNILSVCLHRG